MSLLRGALTALLLAACHGAGSERPPSPSTRVAADTAVPAPADSNLAPVRLELNRTRARPGDRITLTLQNRSDRRYAFNPCTRALERRSEAGWRPVPEPDRICTMEAWLLPAGATRTAVTDLPSALEPGTYRVVLGLTAETPGPAVGDRVRAVSPPLAIAR